MSPAPPGDLGLPFLGEALPFLKDPFTFMTARTARHGNVWKTRILGDTVVFFTGPEAFRFFMNPDNFTRTKGSPPHMQDLFHADAVPFIDGDRFRIRKRLLNCAFTPEAMASYLPGLESLAKRYLAAWADQPEIRLNPELGKLAFDTANVLFAAADPTVRNEAVAKDFDAFIGGMFAPPVSLPWSRFSAAKRARDRLRVYIKEAVGKAPRHGSGGTGLPGAGGGEGTVLGVLKGAKLPGGEQLSEEELRIELLHFFSAVYSPFSGVLAWTVVALGTHPDVMARATEEVRANIGPGPVDTAAIQKLAYVRAVSREVRRAYPIVPLTFFGVALRDLEYGGHAIPKGWKGAGAIWPTLQDGTTFADPATFSPERMADDAFGKLPEFAYCPQGAGPRDGHRCPGDLLVDLLVPQLVALLLRDYTLTLPEQDLAPRPAGIGPMPKGGLRAVIKRRG